jgi:hypothetical protein
MKPLRFQIVIFALLLAVGAVSCTHKKPVLVAPQQPPTTAAPEPSPTPEPATTEPQQTEQQQTEQQPTPAEPAKTNPARTKAKNGHSTAAKKPALPAPGGQKPANEVARSTPTKRVVPADKNTPTPPAGIQISPGPTPADGASNQASTEQLLQSAESNLNGISRQLSKDEEAMKAQIKEFISQSRKATTENDPARAHNLAVKASLLSDALVKQR